MSNNSHPCCATDTHSRLATRISTSVSVDLKSNSNLSEAPGAARLAMRFAAASAASRVEKLAMVSPSRNRECLVASDSIKKLCVFCIWNWDRHFHDQGDYFGLVLTTARGCG